MKHTEEEMKVYPDPTSLDAFFVFTGIQENPVVIAEVGGDRAEADAHLFAAAPKLLAACEAASAHVAMVGNPIGQQLDIAIAKAKVV